MSALLVGLDNPQSSDPRYALYPAPSGCTGHNIMRMMQLAKPDMTLRQYVNIPKINLLPIATVPRGRKQWLQQAGQNLVEQLRNSSYTHVVLLGNDVRNSVLPYVLHGAKFPGELKWIHDTTAVDGEPNFSIAWVPHPSGRNHWYNARGRKKRVGKFLVEAL